MPCRCPVSTFISAACLTRQIDSYASALHQAFLVNIIAEAEAQLLQDGEESDYSLPPVPSLPPPVPPPLSHPLMKSPLLLVRLS